MSDADFVVLLYDLERYAGEERAPNYRPGDTRFFLAAFARRPGRMFHDLTWTASGKTHGEALRSVPVGGARFDRTGNSPSPMVPVEGWRFAQEPLPPVTEETAAIP